MLRYRQGVFRKLNLLGDLLITVAVLLAVLNYSGAEIKTHSAGLLILLTIAIWSGVLYAPSGSYFYRLKSPGKILGELSWALGISFMAFIAALFFLKISFSTSAVLIFFGVDALLLMLFRFSLMAALNFYRQHGRSYRNAIIIGTDHQAREVADRILDNKGLGIQIIGFQDYHRNGLWSYREIPLLGHPDGLAEIISNSQVDYLIIAVDVHDLPLTAHAFAIGEEMGVSVCLVSDPYFHPISKARATNFIDFPAVVYSSVPTIRWQLVMKSCLDRIGGLIGIILSIPVGLLAALAIKIEDGGPVFFKQIRSGKNGKTFTIYKFRTMVTDAEKLKSKLMNKNEMTGPVFKIRKDPRITRTGSWLRRSSVDELPQFINVLRGDMSLVGPRPPLPTEVTNYDRWHRRKLSVKPGLTCLWQVNGRNNVDFDHWMKLDLEYIDNWSIWLDAKILLKTVPAVFKGSGAS